MKTYAIGLMSGTSLDGLDICYARFEYDTKWHFEILKAETIPYSLDWETKLRQAYFLSAEDLYALNSEYGFYLGEKVQEFVEKHGIKTLDLISSHGHTIFHQPYRKFTTQIGDGRAIKLTTNTTTVYDFRTQDVLLGGNGAPLVPIGDELLFSDFDACINLGGFSNISFQKNQKRIAFDICPVNIVLNKWANELNLKFDKDGSIAASNNIDNELLAYWNNLEFYRTSHPKSLGIEWINSKFLLPELNLSPEVLIATASEHAAIQIAEVINQNNLNKILCTGGGSYNSHLIQRVKELTNAKIIIPEETVIDFKEALIFGFMGVLKLHNQNNVLSSATGSKFDHCSGVIA